MLWPHSRYLYISCLKVEWTRMQLVLLQLSWSPYTTEASELGAVAIAPEERMKKYTMHCQMSVGPWSFLSSCMHLGICCSPLDLHAQLSGMPVYGIIHVPSRHVVILTKVLVSSFPVPARNALSCYSYQQIAGPYAYILVWIIKAPPHIPILPRPFRLSPQFHSHYTFLLGFLGLTRWNLFYSMMSSTSETVEDSITLYSNPYQPRHTFPTEATRERFRAPTFSIDPQWFCELVEDHTKN